MKIYNCFCYQRNWLNTVTYPGFCSKKHLKIFIKGKNRVVCKSSEKLLKCLLSDFKEFRAKPVKSTKTVFFWKRLKIKGLLLCINYPHFVLYQQCKPYMSVNIIHLLTGTRCVGYDSSSFCLSQRKSLYLRRTWNWLSSNSLLVVWVGKT